jgi:hypothetical protein
MPRIDKDRKNEYMREYMRRRRSEAKAPELLDAEVERQDAREFNRFRMETAVDLCAIVERNLEAVDNADIDVAVKAKTIFAGVTVAEKLLRLTTYEKRMRELEAASKEKEDSKWSDAKF